MELVVISGKFICQLRPEGEQHSHTRGPRRHLSDEADAKRVGAVLADQIDPQYLQGMGVQQVGDT